MEKKQGTPKGMILYPKTVVELLHIRRQANKGIPIITVFEVEAQNYKYGKKAYCYIIKKQIIDVLDFTLRNEKETIPMYYDATFEKGSEGKITEVERDYNHVYYYFNHEAELKILNELLEHLQNKEATTTKVPIKYTAKHYALAYLFECNIQGVQPPTGKKKELEKIGNERMGVGRGNTFYKALNEISRKDLNIEKNLIDIGREDWKEAILGITLLPEKLNEYLKKKQL